MSDSRNLFMLTHESCWQHPLCDKIQLLIKTMSWWPRATRVPPSQYTNSSSITSSEDFACLSSKRIRNFWVILLNKPGKKLGLCLSPVKPVNIVHQGGCDEQKKENAMHMLKTFISCSGNAFELMFESTHIWFAN